MPSGQTIPFHYKWEELDNNGFSLLGENARYRGAKTEELKEAPTAANLQKADVYIIVDPDTEKETAKPNYMQPEHISGHYPMGEKRRRVAFNGQRL